MCASNTSETIVDPSDSTTKRDSKKSYSEASTKQTIPRSMNIIVMFVSTYFHHGKPIFQGCLFPDIKMQRL